MKDEPLFLLGFPPGENVLTSVDAIRAAYAQHRRARWIVQPDAVVLLTALHAHETWHRLLLLGHASLERRELLHSLFRVVVAENDGVRLLPSDELRDVMADPRAEDLFIGGVVDREDRAILFYRGNLDTLIVPFAWFASRPRAEPNFAAFAITDFGQTVAFGNYETAADAILYEFDPDARRRMRERRFALDTSFGGSVRRLRLQKGLSRSDFGQVDAKTIARIERGEVKEPHTETLRLIARRLGVKPEDLGTY